MSDMSIKEVGFCVNCYDKRYSIHRTPKRAELVYKGDGVCRECFEAIKKLEDKKFVTEG